MGKDVADFGAVYEPRRKLAVGDPVISAYVPPCRRPTAIGD